MKSIPQLLKQINKLNKENAALRNQLLTATQSLDAIKSGNIDALVVGHKKAIKIYTQPTAENTYRILIEKMHEGALTLNEEGIILYCNTYFANMVGMPLQNVIGTKFPDFINEGSKVLYAELFKQGWEWYTQNEVYIRRKDASTIPVLMSANTIFLNNTTVLSIILTDLTLQKSRQAFKSVLIERIIKVIIEMNDSEEIFNVNNSDYISKKLNYDYTYLATLFSEVKGITIQQYIIIHKIEKVKELLLKGELNLTEISYQLNYSSIGHLSNQF